MATLSEIVADLKAKKITRKEARDKKTKLARDKAVKRTKKTTFGQSAEAYNNRRRLAARKRALKSDLKGEERLAESRTDRARGKGDMTADIKLRGAISAKKDAKKARDNVAKIDRVRRLKKEGKTATQIFRDRLAKKPAAKKPAAKKTVVKRAKSTDPNRGNKVPGASSSEFMTRTPRPDFNATKVKKTKPAVKKDSRSTMQKLFGASEEKRAMGRNQMNAARKSMGMNMGGKVKKMNMGGAPMNARGKNMADMEGRAMATGRFRGMPGKMADARGRAMKKGGMVKKCRMDGIALRGKTRAKERSK